MSGMMDKVKHALSHDKDTPESAAANKGSNEYGHGATGGTSGEPHIGETKPGFLQSTERGIHGERDPGTGVTPGYEDRIGGNGGRHATGTEFGSTKGHSGATGQQYDPTSTTSGSRQNDHDITSTAAAAERADYDKHRHDPAHHNQHQQSLAGGHHGLGRDDNTRGTHSSGLTSTGADTNTTNPNDLAGTGSGYDSNNRDRGIAGTGAAAGAGSLAGAGLGSHSQGHHGTERDRDLGSTDMHGTHGGGTGLTGRDRDTTGFGSSGGHQTGYASSTTGSGIGTGFTDTSGPHGSNLANKADPRVDSDRDGSRGLGGTETSGPGYGSTTGSGMGSGSGLGSDTGTGTGFGSNISSGPHSSDLANKADPRVDSDRDGSRNMGAAQPSGTGIGSGMTGSSGLTGEHHGHGEDILHPGPHVTDTAKKLDPHLN